MGLGAVPPPTRGDATPAGRGDGLRFGREASVEQKIDPLHDVAGIAGSDMLSLPLRRVQPGNHRLACNALYGLPVIYPPPSKGQEIFQCSPFLLKCCLIRMPDVGDINADTANRAAEEF